MDKHEDIRYCVRFIRRDGQSDECYHYWHRDEAEHHFNLFHDDDSNLYDRIELIFIAGQLLSVADTIKF